jgi:hypothetical protein
VDEILCFLGSLVFRLSFAMSLSVSSVVGVGRIISFSCCCIGHTLLSSSWLFFSVLCCRINSRTLFSCFFLFFFFFVLRIYSLVDMHFSCKFIKSFLPWRRALSLSLCVAFKPIMLAWSSWRTKLSPVRKKRKKNCYLFPR